MRVAIVGYGVQGKKRHVVAGQDVLTIADPNVAIAWPRPHRSELIDIPLDQYDAALVCTDYLPKYEIIKYLLENGKHVLVEKPLWLPSEDKFDKLERMARKNRCVLYTAYNHRFEPHFVNMRGLVESDGIGQIYRIRMSYGFGTAALVPGTWRNCHPANVLWEIAPHCMDAMLNWVGGLSGWKLVSAGFKECDVADYAVITDPTGHFQIDVSWLSWRNHFTCDVYGEKGSAHIDGLCKWGPSTFTHRKRKLPSGVPDETISTIRQDDPTWEMEYQHFRHLVKTKPLADLSRDRWIYREMTSLSSAILG